jgi:hypothetical protein
MWRPHETSEEDLLAGNDPERKRRRSCRRAWRDGLANQTVQTVVRDLENIRSYRAFERALIGSIDPRSVLELALGRPCLTARAATKRDCGAKPRKRFGPSRRCGSRRLQCGSDCATGKRPSPGIGRGRPGLTHSLATECSDDEGCVRGHSLRRSGKAGRVIRSLARWPRQHHFPASG